MLENSEYTDDQESDPGEEDPRDHILKGHIRVVWYPDGSEDIVSEKKVF